MFSAKFLASYILICWKLFNFVTFFCYIVALLIIVCMGEGCNISGIKFHNRHAPALSEKCPIRSFFWSVFSRIRTEYRPNIQSECGKIRTRKNCVFGLISHSAVLNQSLENYFDWLVWNPGTNQFTSLFIKFYFEARVCGFGSNHKI